MFPPRDRGIWVLDNGPPALPDSPLTEASWQAAEYQRDSSVRAGSWASHFNPSHLHLTFFPFPEKTSGEGLPGHLTCNVCEDYSDRQDNAEAAYSRDTKSKTHQLRYSKPQVDLSHQPPWNKRRTNETGKNLFPRSGVRPQGSRALLGLHRLQMMYL